MLISFNVFIFIVAVLMTASADQEASIFVRVKNNSNYVLEKIEIISPATGLIHFGNVEAGKSSDYKKVSGIYATTAASAEIAGKKIEFLPDDYLGEHHLTSGKYTFSLTITDSNGEKYLKVKLITDDK